MSLTVALKKASAVIELKRLDGLTRGARMSREQSLHGTMGWLMAAQDGTPDDGVSYGYSLYEGWAVSYPETTGYILQTFLWYHDRFCAARGNGAEVLDRARRMAHWEVDVQMDSGATPGNFHNPPLVPVVFNTGQVLLGWAEYLRRFDDDRVRAAALRAGDWLIECMGDKPWFEGGVSAEAQHGNLSYNSMVSWGLAELGDALGEQRFSDAALRSARHYATQLNERAWLTCAGFSDADSSFPLTHTLGYSIQGFIEVGRLCRDEALLQTGKRILDAAAAVIDERTGFLPGRVRPDWQGGADWACLTGSAQFAYSYLRLALMGRGEPVYLQRAASLIDFVVATQQDESRVRPELAYGVRGSYPFRVKGYQPATMPNWAAKFLVDAELLLDEIGGL